MVIQWQFNQQTWWFNGDTIWFNNPDSGLFVRNGLCMYAMHKWMFIVAFTTLSGMEPPSHWDMRRAAGFLFPRGIFLFPRGVSYVFFVSARPPSDWLSYTAVPTHFLVVGTLPERGRENKLKPTSYSLLSLLQSKHWIKTMISSTAPRN